MIHERFFHEFENNNRDTTLLPNVKEILFSVKREIFSGCCFVFSGLLHQKSSVEDQEIWKLAKEFGADCEYEIDDKTTHLISNRVDTEKALESKERGIFAVKPEWIYESCKRWEKLNFEDFKLEIPGNRTKSNHLKRSATELDEDDDEELNEFENEIVYETILNETDFEEIQKELADLEEDSSNDESLQSKNNLETCDYLDAELSDGDFSDLLNEDEGENCSEEDYN